jgi:hypothetical protein
MAPEEDIGPLGTASRGFFRALSRLRGRRIFHPHGVAFAATFEPLPATPHAPAISLLSDPERRQALVRCSRALGVPPSLPDVLGLAVRISDAYGPASPQDFLLVSSSPAPVLRHALLPGPRGFFRHSYSSLLPYAAAGERVLVGAWGTGKGPSPADLEGVRATGLGRTFELRVASLLGQWRPVARLELTEVLPDRVAEEVAFNPWHCGGGLRPTGPLMGLRDPAYRGSQEGRKA